MITDAIVVVCILVLIWRGASRGFLRSLIGPLAFVAAIALAYSYYNISKNVVAAICIGLFGPFALHMLFAFAVRTFDEKSSPPSIISRLLGIAITLTWGMLIILPVILTLKLLPFYPPVQKDITASKTAALSSPLAKYFNLPTLDGVLPDAKGSASASANGAAPAAGGAQNALGVPGSTQNMQNVEGMSTNAGTATAQGNAGMVSGENNLTVNPTGSPTLDAKLQELAKDERIQNIFKDEKVNEAAQKHDYGALMTNEKVLSIMKDPDLIKKILSTYAQAQQNPSTAINQPPVAVPPPEKEQKKK